MPCRLLTLLLALNYFAFRVEPFEGEYRKNHSANYDDVSFAGCTLTWETYDKDNAPQAFIVNAEITLQIVFRSETPVVSVSPFVIPHQPIRDKSPPVAL